MKFSLAILLVVVGLAAADPISKDQQQAMALQMGMEMADGFNSSQCIYKPEERILSCRGPSDPIECNTVLDTTLIGDKPTTRFNIFGISLATENDRSDAKIEQVRYWLHPRRLDNSSYLNHSCVADNGKVVDIVLGCGDKFVDVAGLRVADCKCFARFVKLFDVSTRQPHMVRLETEPTVVQEIPLIGEVLVLDKHVSKRWLWGYGWGGLGLGWGWGGFGWPFWGGLGFWGK
jgi:hypothetical protein